MATHQPEKVAPVHTHNPSASASSSLSKINSNSTTSSMQQFTVGKLDAGMAILLGSRASLIEFPSLLLPQDVTSGSVVEITVKRNLEQERKNQRDLDDLQRNILDAFGRASPTPPELRLRAVTQTSVVLEWSGLELASASLLSLDIYRNGTRLAPIPNPTSNTSTKLSGLGVGEEYAFHLVLKTTAGTFSSNAIRTKTHTMADTSGIAVCFGAVDGGSQVEASEATGGEPVSQLESVARGLLTEMGAKATTKLQIETTHFVCTSPRVRGSVGGGQGAESATYRKALQLNIPIVRPEWIVACWEAKKMVPISAYYIDQKPPNEETVRGLIHKEGGGSDVNAARASSTAARESGATERPTEHQAPGQVDAEGEDQPPPPPAPKDEPTSATTLESRDGDKRASGEASLTAGVGAEAAEAEAAEAEAAEAPAESEAVANGAPEEVGNDTAIVKPEPEQSLEDINLSMESSRAGRGQAAEGGAQSNEDDDGEGEEVDLS